jgi:hypothetical protein
VFALSSAQTLRYIFPVLPALALAGGLWLATRLPRVASGLQVAVALLLMVAAAIFWVRPALLGQPGNDVFKEQGDRIRAQTARDEPITYMGDRYWTLANPTMLYAERLLEMPPPLFEEAVLRAAARPSRLLMLDDAPLAQLVERRVPHAQVLKGGGWTLVRVHRGARRALQGLPPL